ncbi:unnamed protein product, partial [Chrysoparadoxa australica]
MINYQGNPAISVKLLLTLSSFLILSSAIFGQKISGRIFSEQTKEPIPFANVYFDNSLNGTVSDVDGYFELDISSNPGQEIIVSSVGYEIYLLKDYISEKSYNIYLKDKVTMLGEVEISYDDGLTRKQKMRVFKREFFGNTKNAQSCIIENEDDLRLVYSDSDKSYRAFCDVPIVIINRNLGYKILYDLVEFISIDQQRLSYKGYSQFEQDSIPKTDLKRIKKRRERTYRGSRLEFFRLLWDKK